MNKYIQKVQKTNTKIYKYHTSYNKYYLTNSAIVVIQSFLLSLLLYPHFTFFFCMTLCVKMFPRAKMAPCKSIFVQFFPKFQKFRIFLNFEIKKFHNPYSKSTFGFSSKVEMSVFRVSIGKTELEF